MSPEAIGELGRVLVDAGYDEDGIARALGGIDLLKARLLHDAWPRSADDPLHTLVELFYVLRPVSRARAVAALDPLDPDALVDSGLLATDGDLVAARFQISPWLGLLVAHDRYDNSIVPSDFVAGGTMAAETLARATVRLPVASILDVGTGSGVQALLAARHSARVVAVDVNPRAVELTRINAALNGFPQLEAREGDWFEPVAGEEFELVVANPPFVVSPDVELLFRDGDRARDGDLHGPVPEVVRGVAESLAPGGIGHVLVEWAVTAGEERYAAVRGWTEGLGRDVCVVDFGASAPLEYATRWSAHLALAEQVRYGPTVERWLAYFEQHRVEEFRFGLLVLRRGFSQEHWFHAVEAAGRPHGDGGRQLLRIIEAQDFLTGTGLLEPRLGDERLEPVDGHAVVERNAFERGNYHPEPPTLTLDDGLGTLVTIEPWTLEILLALDGRRSLDEALAELAPRLDADPAELAELGTAAVRDLLALGFVTRR